jgi:hypothetical protein
MLGGVAPKKNPHAVALGRLGGAANSPAQQAQRRANAAKAGATMSPKRLAHLRRLADANRKPPT